MLMNDHTEQRTGAPSEVRVPRRIYVRDPEIIRRHVQENIQAHVPEDIQDDVPYDTHDYLWYECERIARRIRTVPCTSRRAIDDLALRTGARKRTPRNTWYDTEGQHRRRAHVRTQERLLAKVTEHVQHGVHVSIPCKQSVNIFDKDECERLLQLARNS